MSYQFSYSAFRGGISKRAVGSDETLILLAMIIDRIGGDHGLWFQLGRVVAIGGADKFAMMEIESLLKKDSPKNAA
jgi:hypothetical protein